MIAYAQQHIEVAQSWVSRLEQAILFPLMTLMMSVAFLVFIWGGFQFVAGAADEGARATGKRHMLFGIIGLLIMISAYAILRIAVGTFGVDA